nr:BamA/TamA family outer membrane protein [Porphyromonas macacae]
MVPGADQYLALAFVEAGNAWFNLDDYNPFDLRRSAGVGVRITLPMVGLVGIDWAYGFDRPNPFGERGGSNIHFVLGRDI